MSKFHLHLVSDATGETVQTVSRACLAQFDDAQPMEHNWNLIRRDTQLVDAIAGIKENPGFVLYTLVNDDFRTKLLKVCQELQIPCVSVLQPIMAAFGGFLKTEIHAEPGRQYTMDGEYYSRISAMDYALMHDDGQATWNLEEADIVVLGVSRTSKTPTCMYLANRGLKVANVPIILGHEPPEELFELKKPFIVGLTRDTRTLVQVRRNRLRVMNQENPNDYADPGSVADEVNFAQRLYTQQGWPIIDVTRRSIEETAAAIMQLKSQIQDQQ